MTVERTSFVSGLDEQNPRSLDMIKEGDDHIRLTKSTLRNTFPRFDRRTEISTEQLNKLYNWIFSVEDDPTEPESIDMFTVLESAEFRDDILLTKGGEDGTEASDINPAKISGLSEILFTTDEQNGDADIPDEKYSRAVNLRTADARYARLTDFDSLDASKLTVLDGETRKDVAVATDGVLTVISKLVVDEIEAKTIKTNETIATLKDLEVSGDLRVTGKIFRGSDASIKFDVKDFPEDVTVDNIRPVVYRKGGVKEFGVIAQELHEDFHHLLGDSHYNNLLTVDYIQFIPLLIKEIQRLKKELVAVENSERETRDLLDRLAQDVIVSVTQHRLDMATINNRLDILEGVTPEEI